MSTEDLNNADTKSTTFSKDTTLPLLCTNSEQEARIFTATDNRRFSLGNANNVNAKSHFVSPLLLSYNKGEEDIGQWSNIVKDASNDKSEVLPDIAAMSVLSLYQNNVELEKNMDTDRDLEDIPALQTNIERDGVHNDLKLKMNNTNHISETKCNCNGTSQSHNNRSFFKCPKPTIYFRDGKRSVDFVLVWDELEEDAVTEEAYQRRRLFEENLMKEGLQLEYEAAEKNGLSFVKVHAPKEVLRRYSEILKLRMPMREELCKLPREFRQRRFDNATSCLRQKLPCLVEGCNAQWEKIKSYIFVDKKVFPEKGHRFTAIYSRDREYLFDVDSPCFFTPAIHSRIVQFILDRKKFSGRPNDDFAFGVERLINEKVYTAVYPLHDGDLKQKGSMRYLLYNEWAAVRKWYRYQPLDYVKEYFGVKIALYFAWLGFYTHMLLPASLVGVACFIYSCVTLYDNKPSEDVCNSTHIKMCPLCDHWCDYWEIKETCLHARFTYLFDNPSTVFFVIFMSFWATLFLELWKRYSAEITHRWDLTGFDVKEEHPRPEYLARLSHVKRRQINVVTNTIEPQVPFWRRVPATILSFSVVLLLVALALAAVLGVVLYRMSVLASLRVLGDRVTTSSAFLFTTSTAACINLCCIFVFNWIYSFVALYLTEMELLRTQSEFDDSLTLKMYLLQFVNYYASIFYIAFFKGKFIGLPKEYNKIFGYRQEEVLFKSCADTTKCVFNLIAGTFLKLMRSLIYECGPGGCLIELCIQLAIIMIGKQAMSTALEMLFPLYYKLLNTLKVKTGLQKGQLPVKEKQPQWVKDFKLVEWGPRSLFPEYLEMILQYGFLTIFVAAFPLAPLFALLNNILEMRLDARKLLTFYRRPVTQRVRDIGVWYRILDSIGKLSVVTNGFIIAFTSNFIPRLVYIAAVSQDHTLNGYLNFTLSYFNTSDFQVGSAPTKFAQNVSICRYPDYREPPWSSNKYGKTSMFWHILVARLAFVVVFENVVAFVMIVVKWCIPDVPKDLSEKIRREAFITNEIIIKQETLRAQASHVDEQEKLSRLNVLGLGDCPSTPEQWDQLIGRSLSGSEFDLMVHRNSLPSVSSNHNAGLLKSPTSV